MLLQFMQTYTMLAEDFISFLIFFAWPIYVLVII